MAHLNGFNAHEVEPNTAFDPLPAGKYMAAITASEVKPTKNGDGTYLELTFEVVDGEYRGRKVWDRLCINHPNAMTVKIARGNLSAICRATGVMQPRDSVELHNIPLLITVKCRKRQDTGDLSNEVKGYEPKTASQLGGGTVSVTSGAGASGGGGGAQQAPVTSNTPPWKR